MKRDWLRRLLLLQRSRPGIAKRFRLGTFLFIVTLRRLGLAGRLQRIDQRLHVGDRACDCDAKIAQHRHDFIARDGYLIFHAVEQRIDHIARIDKPVRLQDCGDLVLNLYMAVVADRIFDAAIL